MIERIISGGQTGVDQAALRVAKSFQIPTGGWAPKGYLTETGPAPWLAREYGLREAQFPAGEPTEPRWKWDAQCYRFRNGENAAEADVCLWYGDPMSRGAVATFRAADKAEIPVLVHVRDSHYRIFKFLDHCRILWIAGNRESGSPGIGKLSAAYFTSLFTELGFQDLRR
jgi:hypothetical protein